MNYLSVEQLDKRYGERVLFEDVNFGVQQGQKIALIAANGSGKTTLLRILAGLEPPDDGKVIWRSGIRVAYLDQDPQLDAESTVLDTVFNADIPIMNVVRDYERLLREAPESTDFERAAADMERMSAWDYESKATQILGALGIVDLKQKTGTLSGGQKRRVALAQVLLSEPDFLILDEPTNHLDLDMIEWLEQYLVRSNITLFMVTHDRYYLESVCDEIYELEEGALIRYRGNFSYYLEKKAEREEQQAASLERARNIMRKELEWVRTSPSARTTKSKSRLDRFEAVQAAARGRKEQDNIRAEINMERLGSKIVEFHKVKKSFGNRTILNGFDYHFRRGERMGIVGRNGSGKTTFLRLILGQEVPEGGKIVAGETVVFGYYSQEGIQLKPGMRVIEAIREIAEVVPLKGGQKLGAAELLERFMFPRKRHYEFIERLSGGEKKRLFLCTILMRNPNFLILDEPTNDLDIFTLAALEEYLESYMGCLVVVSHDRYFMDKLVEHILWFKGQGEVRDIPGNYTIYREQLLEEEQARLRKNSLPDEPADKTQARVKDKPKTKLSFKEKREFELLEAELPALELRKKELETLLASGKGGYEEINAWTFELSSLMKDMDAKEIRWLELSELAENS
jgi:ATP-binding cassette subfamily F protein uup